MPVETVSSESGEIVTLDEAKLQLGIWDDGMDAYVTSLIQQARDFCSRWSERTLRLSATRTYATRNWPSDGWVLRHPPVLAVSSIAYYDTNNAQQTLASSNYHVNVTADGFGRIEWSADADRPSVYDRPDAVTVTYTTGYASAEVAPATAKAAMILVMQALDETEKPAVSDNMMARAKNMLTTVSAPTYA